MGFTYDQRLDGMLSSIESTLIAELPSAVGRLSVAEPCYALFLWYTDSSFDDHSPRFGIGTQSILTACAAQYPADNLSRIDCTWRPHQTIDDYQLIPQHGLTAQGLGDRCNSAYSLILAANKAQLPLPDEREILMPYRSMMRRVAVQLSKHDWTGTLRTMDTFVVVALDAIGEWLDEDLQACIPAPQFRLLEQRGMLAT